MDDGVKVCISLCASALSCEESTLEASIIFPGTSLSSVSTLFFTEG